MEVKLMPMDRSLYPKNWEAIAYRIKDRANWCCQECRRQCKRPDQDWSEFLSCGCVSGEMEAKPTRFILTVAHLNHIPSDCSDENLRALCTVCHLRYDARQMALKRRLKRERLGQLTLNLEK
jgi:hypothetical protein